MGYQINTENGVANRGNLARIKNVMKRARNGEKLTIGFIGGSITQGSLSSTPELCYAYRVYEWWCKTFPQTEFVYINAGIGATTSQFGAARVKEDLLKYNPDFVITEFSVNDDSTEHFLETYEGLVRQIYYSDKKPAVLIVHNVYYHNGANAQLQHSKVGRYYDIPCVSMQSSIYPEVVSGKIPNREITPDDLHPNDAGHELVAGVITDFLSNVLIDIDNDETEPEEQKVSLTRNSYEHSVRFRNKDIFPDVCGFTADTEPQEHITDIFKCGWYADKSGASIGFDVESRGIAVQYRKSVKQPAPTARVIVDGDRENAILLDANFEENWGDKLELQTIIECDELKNRHVEIVIEDVKENNQVPFYLVSIITNSVF